MRFLFTRFQFRDHLLYIQHQRVPNFIRVIKFSFTHFILKTPTYGTAPSACTPETGLSQGGTSPLVALAVSLPVSGLPLPDSHPNWMPEDYFPFAKETQKRDSTYASPRKLLNPQNVSFSLGVQGAHFGAR